MNNKLHKERPIAVFDSGVGGVSVLRELIKIMPSEDYIYMGDSKNAPYGTRPKEEVRKLTIAWRHGFIWSGPRACIITWMARERQISIPSGRLFLLSGKWV